MNIVATRVAKGANWLDRHYPTWWEQIDLSTLNVASSSQCLLGQVYTKVIPDAEKDQVMAKALSMMPRSMRSVYAVEEWAKSGAVPGFNILAESHGIVPTAWELGFACSWASSLGVDGQPVSAGVEMEALTTEWTRVVIERRIEANLAEVSELWRANRAEVAALVGP